MSVASELGPNIFIKARQPAGRYARWHHEAAYHSRVIGEPYHGILWDISGFAKDTLKRLIENIVEHPTHLPEPPAETPSILLIEDYEVEL